MTDQKPKEYEGFLDCDLCPKFPGTVFPLYTIHSRYHYYAEKYMKEHKRKYHGKI